MIGPDKIRRCALYWANTAQAHHRATAEMQSQGFPPAYVERANRVRVGIATKIRRYGL